MRLRQTIKAIGAVLKLRNLISDLRETNRLMKEPRFFYKVELEEQLLSQGIVLSAVWLANETTIPTYRVAKDLPSINITDTYEALRIFLTNNGSSWTT